MSVEWERLLFRAVINPIRDSLEYKTHIKGEAIKTSKEALKQVLPRGWKGYCFDKPIKPGKVVKVVKVVKKVKKKAPRVCLCVDIVDHFLRCRRGGPYFKKVK